MICDHREGLDKRAGQLWGGCVYWLPSQCYCTLWETNQCCSVLGREKPVLFLFCRKRSSAPCWPFSCSSQLAARSILFYLAFSCAVSCTWTPGMFAVWHGFSKTAARARYLIRGAWYEVHGTRYLVRGSWYSVPMYYTVVVANSVPVFW